MVFFFNLSIHSEMKPKVIDDIFPKFKVAVG